LTNGRGSVDDKRIQILKTQDRSRMISTALSQIRPREILRPFTTNLTPLATINTISNHRASF